MFEILAYSALVYVIIYLLAVLVSRAIATRYEHRGRPFRVRWNTWLPRLLGVPSGGVAVFGVIWFGRGEADAPLVAHEARHLEQERRLLYVGYLPAYVIGLVLGRGYWNNPMEVDARAFARAAHRDHPHLAA